MSTEIGLDCEDESVKKITALWGLIGEFFAHYCSADQVALNCVASRICMFIEGLFSECSPKHPVGKHYSTSKMAMKSPFTHLLVNFDDVISGITLVKWFPWSCGTTEILHSPLLNQPIF